MVMIVIAAFLASAAFAPISLWFLGLIGYFLYFRKIFASKKPIFFSFAFGFIYNATVLHWAGIYVGAVPWILLALLQALFYIPVGYIAKRTQNLWWGVLTVLLMEELRSRFPFGGFGWTRVAFSQVESPLLPIVSIGGVLALSAITLISAALMASFSLRNLLVLIAIFLGAASIPDNPQGSGSIRFLAIQGNTPSVGLDFNSRAEAVFKLHRDATYRFAKTKYDVIVWPENAIDIDPKDYPVVSNDIRKLTKKLASPLIAGVVENRNGVPLNASIMYSKDGEFMTEYVKRGLTPFGEYMPLRGLAQLVSPFASQVVDFQKGNHRQVHTISGEDVGPVICYEIISDHLVADMAKHSSALIVQTNSATFAGTAESRQQLAITRIRAVENSRYILSVSTIGISALIDNNGRVISQTKENLQSSLTGDLKMSQSQTFANRYGKLSDLAMLLFISFLGIRYSRRGA
jgi:apolipoprotein N-acyltransferase